MCVAADMDGSSSRGKRAARTYDYFGRLAAVRGKTPSAKHDQKYRSDENRAHLTCTNVFDSFGLYLTNTDTTHVSQTCLEYATTVSDFTPNFKSSRTFARK